VTIVAPVLGPILGGWITDNWNWAWIFYINVPIGIVATLLTAALLRGRETPTARVPVDFVGIGLLALGIGSLQIMLDRGKDLDWFGSPAIVALAAVALVGLAFFVAWELTEKQPAVDLTLFARRNFTAERWRYAWGSAPTSATSCCCRYGCRRRWATPRPGPGSLPRPSDCCPSPSWHSSHATRAASTCGGSRLQACALSRRVVLVRRLQHRGQLPMLAWSRFAQGVRLALFFVPLMSIVLSGLPPGRVASASGLANTLRTLAGSFATSLTTTWWDRREALHQAHLSESITLFNSPPQAQTAFATLERSIVQQAYMLGDQRPVLALGLDLPRADRVVWFARPPFSAAGTHAAADKR